MSDNLPNVDEIFCAAIELSSPEERREYVERACGGNAELRRRVDALLAAHFGAGDFLERSPATALLPDHENVQEIPGTLIGPYKLLEQIGEGGMGVVYMADQQAPVRRRVALKIIKPGMDTRQVIARFEAERQAVEMMDHPNIARVLDAGTTDTGRPYFVMDLVKGVPITEYCDQQHLSVRQRLELMAAVCQAVQHAHQKGIIHRDLKPSNVLVAEYDGKPVPKVIDFGVAKATAQRLTERTMFTQYGQIVGTFEYMSPEQARFNQLDVDTRSDIYSLGVLLYEVLAGSTPLEKERLRSAAYDEVLRIICEEEPPSPSTRLSSSQSLPSIAANRSLEPKKLSGLIRGELDWIVMKCLEKDRTRRFETANGLAQDIAHYLADEQVQACPPSAAYRMRKFARKYKRLLVTVTALATLLVVATIGAVLAAVQFGRLAEKESELRSAAEQRAHAEAKARKDLDQRLYVNRIALAQQELFAQNTGRAQELLDECPTHLRGWEWYFLRRFRSGNPLNLGRRTGAAFSPDGRSVALVRSVTNADIIDTATGTTIRTLHGLANWIEHYGLAFCTSAGEMILAAGDYKGKFVKLWNVETGQEIQTLDGHGDRLRTVVFSPDGQQLAAGSISSGAKVWDWRRGQVVFELPGLSISRFAYSPDGRHLAVAVFDNEKAVIIYEAATGREIGSFGQHSGGIEGIAYSPNSRRLATSGSDGTVKIWNEVTGQLLQTLRGHVESVMDVVFTPDGRRLASAGEDKTIKIWDAETGQEILTLRGHTGAVKHLEFSPNGHLLVSTAEDGAKLWNATPGGDVTGSQEVSIPGHTNIVTSVAFSPDGRFLASAALDRLIKLWDVASLRQGTEPQGVTLHGDNELVVSVAFSPDSRRLACAGWGGSLKVWDTASSQPLLTRSLQTHERGNNIRSIAFSPDGRRIASLGPGALALRDATSGQKLQVIGIPLGDLNGLAYSPDGQYLATCIYHDVTIWDLETAKKVCSCPNNGMVWSVAYSPDGKHVASASFDQTVKIHDAIDGKEIRTLRGHTDRVVCVAFSPDGKHLASGSGDSTVKVWDAANGKELATFRGHTGYVRSVAFSPDGKWLASGGGHQDMGEVKIWDFASTLAAANQPERVDKTSRQAIEFYEMLAIAQPNVCEHRRNLGHTHAQLDQWDKAAAAYKKFSELAPQDGYIWSTLGVACYRAGEWKSAIEALDKSTKLPRRGGASDWFFLAMAHWQLDHKDEARKWFDKAVAWMDKTQSKNDELTRFRDEAAELLGISEPAKSTGSTTKP